MNADDFSARLNGVAEQVETGLQAALADRIAPGEIARPKRLVDAMRYAALAGGKRLRPFLTIETARALGAAGDPPLRAGLAVECVHCYSLVHDDLPAMDDDDLRRGRPTTHKAFDEATAILAGDGLLTLAFDILADPATHKDAETRVALCLGLARASGLGGMVGGQMLDIEAETAATPLDDAAIRRLQAMKTGALLRFAVEAGAIVAGAAADRRAALVRYGEALGSAFQVADDILDAEATSEQLGKRAGKDADRNKGTFVSIHGLDGAKRLRDAFVDAAIAALGEAGFQSEGDVLRAAARFVAARAK
jgi:farnesyl diphosphate synthase